MGLKSSIKEFLTDKKWRSAQWVVLFAALVFACMECDDGLYAHWKYSEKINELENEIQMYKDKMQEDSTNLLKIKTNKESIERLARERFFMKKENEDVFIVVE